MKKKTIIFIIYLLINFFTAQKIISETIFWKINDIFKIDLIISDNFKTRQIGLMNRKDLKINEGMIFIYEELEPVNIWMYKTFIPLDIIFIKDFKIIKIVENANPCLKLPCPLYGSITPIDRVIEINAGLSKSLNLKVGDYINLYR